METNTVVSFLSGILCRLSTHLQALLFFPQLPSQMPLGFCLLTPRALLCCPVPIFQPSSGKSVHFQRARVPEPRPLPLLLLIPF